MYFPLIFVSILTVTKGESSLSFCSAFRRVRSQVHRFPRRPTRVAQARPRHRPRRLRFAVCNPLCRRRARSAVRWAARSPPWPALNRGPACRRASRKKLRRKGWAWTPSCRCQRNQQLQSTGKHLQVLLPWSLRRSQDKTAPRKFSTLNSNKARQSLEIVFVFDLFSHLQNTLYRPI